MVLPYDKRRVRSLIAAQGSGQQSGLHVPQQPGRHFLFHEGMHDDFFFPVLPGQKEGFTQFLFHHDSTGFGFPELFRFDLMSIDEGTDQSVNQIRPEFFHQVER